MRGDMEMADWWRLCGAARGRAYARDSSSKKAETERVVDSSDLQVLRGRQVAVSRASGYVSAQCRALKCWACLNAGLLS